MAVQKLSQRGREVGLQIKLQRKPKREHQRVAELRSLVYVYRRGAVGDGLQPLAPEKIVFEPQLESQKRGEAQSQHDGVKNGIHTPVDADFMTAIRLRCIGLGEINVDLRAEIVAIARHRLQVKIFMEIKPVLDAAENARADAGCGLSLLRRSRYAVVNKAFMQVAAKADPG